MRVVKIVKIEMQSKPGYLDLFREFQGHYEEFQGSAPDQFIFPEDQLNAVLKSAKNNGIKYRLHHQLIPDDLSEFPAYKLNAHISALKEIVSDKNFKKDGILYDFNTKSFVLNQRVKSIFDKMCSSIKWKKKEDKSLWYLAGSASAIQPLYIEKPAIIFKNKVPKGTYTIIGDGFELISNEDLLNLNKFGILEFNNVKTPKKTYKTPATFLLANKLKAELYKEEILTGFVFPIVTSELKSKLST